MLLTTAGVMRSLSSKTTTLAVLRVMKEVPQQTSSASFQDGRASSSPTWPSLKAK